MKKFIGTGEPTLTRILNFLFDNDVIISDQAPIWRICPYQEDWGLSKRQKKETVDFFLLFPDRTKLVIRVQDSHHSTRKFAQIDRIQRDLLERNGCYVVDLYWNECPELFKENFNELSISETLYFLNDKGFTNEPTGSDSTA